jgi:aromatic ring-opening dioxygenase catalytic subunit (LigB family)
VELCNETRWVLDGAKGIIVVTAHWETDQPHISSGAKPELYFDYFEENAKELPKEAWEFSYPAPGDPELANKIKEKLERDGFEPVLDSERGWDHGVWVPLLLLRPEADLPVVQVSIPKGEEFAATKSALKMGRSLEAFREEGYIILGSGSSYHNFAAVIDSIEGKPGAPPIESNRPFEDAMEEVAKIPDADEKCRRMQKWRDFPASEAVQPPNSSEHFLPFIVNIGSAGSDIGKKLGEWELFGTIMSSYIW